MKITVVCGHGLGSSLMMEMTIKQMLTTMGVDAEVDHIDLSSISSCQSDIYVGTRDITAQFSGIEGQVVSLDNIIDKKAMQERLAAAIDTLA